LYSNNSQNSSKFKGCRPLQLSCNLTGKCHAIGYYSYTNRYILLQKREKTMNRTLLSLAIIRTNWEQLGKDYIENYVPLLATLIKKKL